MDGEPFTPAVAKKMILSALADGVVRFTKHGLSEMRKDGLAEIDVTNVLRGGVVQPGEWEHGAWRYRVRTPRMVVVAEFASELVVVVVTAWRMR